MMLPRFNFSLFAIFISVIGFGQISARLGQDRRFGVGAESPLHQLGRVQMPVQNVASQRSTCCNVCKTNFPSVPNDMLTGACDSRSMEIDGPAFGPGIRLNELTVNTYGFVDVNLDTKGSTCCEECLKSYPSTRMFRYWSKSIWLPNWKGCWCHSPKSGQQPRTYAEETFSAGCGCNGLIHGITCCSAGFTRGDSVDASYMTTAEIFIQADQYQSTCAETCKSLHPSSTGITESLKQTYTSGNGANKNKCWCEFGEPKLDYSNMDYQTCVFSA